MAGLSILTKTTTGLAAEQPIFRHIEWQLDAASGLVLGGQGSWAGQTLSGQRLSAGRLSVLRIIGTQGEDILIAVDTKRPERESVPRQCAAFALPGSLWQPVSSLLLVVAVRGGWVVQGTLVRG